MRGQVLAVKQLGPEVANLLIETRDVLLLGEDEAVYSTSLAAAEACEAMIAGYLASGAPPSAFRQLAEVS